MIRKMLRPVKLNKLSIRLYFSLSVRQQFTQKLSKKKYREILGFSENRKDIFKQKDLHRAYLNQIKKFHSDNVQTQEAKKQFQQITKCIISAYEELKKEDENYVQSNKNEKNIYQDEDEVSQQLFQKEYNQVKYQMYQPGNQQMRNKFLEELKNKKIRQNKNYEENPKTEKKPQDFSANYSQPAGSNREGSLLKFLAIAVVCGLISIPILSGGKDKKSTQPKKQNKVIEYQSKDYDLMEENAKKILMKPYQQFYNSILKRRPHMLNYPTGKDPHVMQQLTKYSIAQDICLFQVPSKYLLNLEESQKILKANSAEAVEKYQLTQTKPNTLLTLSLQAERILQNIYVEVDDVINEIKKTGKYTPPQILFKYHGFMMFQIRNKTFSTLQCYKNTKYISLFDLYFDYYSPIFFKRDHFREYLVGFQEEAPLNNHRYFGNVYLNYRQIPKIYLQRGKKVAIMREVEKGYSTSGELKTMQQMYKNDWQGYYQRFEKNWKKYCSHQKEGKIQY